MIHCRIYQSVKSQWEWKKYSSLLLLPWRVLLLIDLYSCIYLLIFASFLKLAFLCSFWKSTFHYDSLYSSSFIIYWYIFLKSYSKLIFRLFLVMSNAEKIQVAEKRIIELKTLINHWKTSNISSRKATVDFVESILSESNETKTA